MSSFPFALGSPLVAGPGDGGEVSVRLVNTVPGFGQEALKPDQILHMGLKSTVGEVVLGSLRIDFGTTGLIHEGVFPESNQNLEDRGIDVSIETSEHRRPISDEASRTLTVDGELVVLKTNNDLGQAGVYEMKIPIKPNASLLARVKIRKKVWTLSDPDWMNLDGMTGIYVGLEHGTYNTCANVFLRNNGGSGELVIGGPLSNYNTARPGQSVVSFDWVGLANEVQFELFIYINTTGRPAPFSPAYAPIVEVWTKTPTDGSPVVREILAIGDLGQFPNSSSSFSNRRAGSDDVAVLYIGNIGQSGDVLQIDDWQFYVSYSQLVLQGEPLPDSKLLTLPDGPVVYRASEGKLPSNLDLGRWLKYTGSNAVEPSASLFFNPGRRNAPVYTTIQKSLSSSQMAFQKEEPRLRALSTGVMIEAFISGDIGEKNGQNLGIGFGLEDGDKTYRVYLLDDSNIRTFGILKSFESISSFDGFHVPGDSSPVEFDHSSLKLVRLLVDRFRSKVSLFIENEDTPVLTIPITEDFPPATSITGRVFFGHLDVAQTSGKMNVAFLNYLTQYAAWEGVDEKLPDDEDLDFGVQFTETGVGIGESVLDLDDDTVVISKDVYTALGSNRYFSKEQDFSPRGGVQVDFRVKVLTYNNFGGQQNAPKTNVGVGIRIYFGVKMLNLGFYDCGIHGRKIGILPGSGTVEDILNQTTLGRQFSADVDFNEMTTYRLVCRAGSKIEVWANTIKNKPLFEVPWKNDTDGFDLPLESDTAPSLCFGHFEQFSSSVSKWEFIRWGQSSGYEISVQRLFPDGYEKHLFGGKSLAITEFEDVA